MNLIASTEELVNAIAEWIKLSTEAISILLIGLGIIVTLYWLYKILRKPSLVHYNKARLTFSRYLVFALEFMLAGDIVATAINPNWTDLGRLAIIAAIRTFLNFFLQREMKEEEREVGEASEPARR